MADPFSMAMIGSLGSIGLPSFAMNQVSSAINSSRAWKYQQKAMRLQDELNRKFTHDQYSINRSGLVDAGYNPLLALPHGSQGAIYGSSPMNSDSDAGDQAVNSAINSMTAKANIENLKENNKNIKENTEKIKAEKEGIELDNRLKTKTLNTDPKAVVSDLVEGNETPVTNFIHKGLEKLGIVKGSSNSAVSNELPNLTEKNVIPTITGDKNKSTYSAVSSKAKSLIGNAISKHPYKTLAIMGVLSHNPELIKKAIKGKYNASFGKKGNSAQSVQKKHSEYLGRDKGYDLYSVPELEELAKKKLIK